jgi:hypothetical protein
VWRDRVEASQEEFERARVAAARAVDQLTCDAGSGAIEAAMEASRRESVAFEELRRVMKVFHDLVVYGKRPESQ